MILFVPEKSFHKKIQKWVIHKEFLIADATDHHDGKMKEYGNVLSADEIAPTPSLTLIATDPDSEDAKIKRRKLSTYLDMWMSDDAFVTKVNYLVECLVRMHEETGEDVNIFVVMRNSIFYAYHQAVEERINEDYENEICSWITHKMDKKEIKARLLRNPSPKCYKALKKRTKEIRKRLKIDERKIVVDSDDYDLGD